jgi:hypothetical protein
MQSTLQNLMSYTPNEAEVNSVAKTWYKTTCTPFGGTQPAAHGFACLGYEKLGMHDHWIGDETAFLTTCGNSAPHPVCHSGPATPSVRLRTFALGGSLRPMSPSAASPVLTCCEHCTKPMVCAEVMGKVALKVADAAAAKVGL